MTYICTGCDYEVWNIYLEAISTNSKDTFLFFLSSTGLNELYYLQITALTSTLSLTWCSIIISWQRFPAPNGCAYQLVWIANFLWFAGYNVVHQLEVWNIRESLTAGFVIKWRNCRVIVWQQYALFLQCEELKATKSVVRTCLHMSFVHCENLVSLRLAQVKLFNIL